MAYNEDEDSDKAPIPISEEDAIIVASRFLGNVYKRMSAISSTSRTAVPGWKILPPALLVFRGVVHSKPKADTESFSLEDLLEEGDSKSKEAIRFSIYKVSEWPGYKDASSIPPRCRLTATDKQAIEAASAMLWIGPDGHGKHKYILLCREASRRFEAVDDTGDGDYIIPGLWKEVSTNNPLPPPMAHARDTAWTT